jgi:hypothetical protein
MVSFGSLVQSLDLLSQLRDNFEQISNNSIVGNSEDGSFFINVNSDDNLSELDKIPAGITYL